MFWRIRDFKGIREAGLDLQPGKLTVLTGVNSSGKSSVSQSLLLAAQSLYQPGPIVLNGPLVRLGESHDLVREGASAGVVSLGATLDFGGLEDDSILDPTELRVDLSPSSDRLTLQARRITLARSTQSSSSLVADRQNRRSGDVQKVLDEIKGGSDREEVLHLKSLLDNESTPLRTYIAMRGLKPVRVVQILSAPSIAKKYKTGLESAISEFERGRTRSESFADAYKPEFPGVVKEFVRLLVRSNTAVGSLRDLVDKFAPIRNGNPYRFASAWSDCSQMERQALINLAVRARSSSGCVSIPILDADAVRFRHSGVLESQLLARLGESFPALAAAVDTLNSLATRVQYLGPLRDEPRVVWNHWNELARGLPVGTRGEYSAVVLSRSRGRFVEYCPPGRESLITSKLDSAINAWLSYLSIGDTVSAVTQGKLGVGLELVVKGRTRDLTSVGVGVSQALPLVVGLLSAPRESIFIVEQPELHLHPAVQARLADFLLVARPDLCLVVETHSEALITRIRRRVAEGSAQPGRVDITFVEAGESGSLARQLELSEFGDLDEWPADFLGSAEEDIRAILRANISRMGVAD